LTHDQHAADEAGGLNARTFFEHVSSSPGTPPVDGDPPVVPPDEDIEVVGWE
jgi:hypothetical protein